MSEEPTPYRVAVPAKATVGEGPVIHPRTGALVWVDIAEGALHVSDLRSGRTDSLFLNTMLGAAVPRVSAPGFAVAVTEGFGYVLDGELQIVDPALPNPMFRMNDAKCDARGRMWAGSTHKELLPGAGRLHRWDGERPSEVIMTGLGLPNGIGWSPDGTRMYLVDSLARVILVAHYDLESGVPGEFEILAQIDEGLPDGLAVDEGGDIWVAVWDGACVRRFTSRGAAIDRIVTPMSRPTSCVFAPGGRLLVTTARSAEQDAGSVLEYKVDRQGAMVGSFRC